MEDREKEYVASRIILMACIKAAVRSSAFVARKAYHERGVSPGSFAVA